MKSNWNNINIPRKQVATCKWSAPHAAIVHEGATLKSGTVLPPRPWVDRAIEEFDAPKSFAEAYKQSGDFREAFESMAVGFGKTTQEGINSDIWEWPRETHRQNGSIVGSPRDIVDTGELRDSYTLEIE